MRSKREKSETFGEKKIKDVFLDKRTNTTLDLYKDGISLLDTKKSVSIQKA